VRPLHPLTPTGDHIVAWFDRPRVKITARRMKKWRRRYAKQALKCCDKRGFNYSHDWRPSPSRSFTTEFGPTKVEICCRCRCTFTPIPF
jgi:hypothetical protein